MLVLADRGLYGFKLWSQAAATGADLLWRVKTTLPPRHLETLPDGSWLARIVATSGTAPARPPLNVRVIDYTIDDGRDNPEQYRLLTTILDPDQASAKNWPCLHPALGNRERLRRTQNPPARTARGAALEVPDLVQQEMWGHLCCHYAIRTLMLDAAPRRTRPRPRYPSSQHYVSPEDRCPTALFPPHNHDAVTTLWQSRHRKLTHQRINPARRIRANPRVVKRKVLKWAAKRSHHTRWPQPSHHPQISISLN